jgi:bifunctional DNA-binding transcriptional regulator/antitoxin component of YhaV-PrlF toxin-antitoxin module
MNSTAKIQHKGQVTIPTSVRRRYHPHNPH